MSIELYTVIPPIINPEKCDMVYEHSSGYLVGRESNNIKHDKDSPEYKKFKELCDDANLFNIQFARKQLTKLQNKVRNDDKPLVIREPSKSKEIGVFTGIMITIICILLLAGIILLPVFIKLGL